MRGVSWLRHSEQSFPLISTLVGIWNHGCLAFGKNLRGSCGSAVPLAYDAHGDGDGGEQGHTLVGSLHATPEQSPFFATQLQECLSQNCCASTGAQPNPTPLTMP